MDITLRHFIPADLPAYTKIVTQPGVAEPAGLGIMAPAMVAQQFKRMQADPQIWAILADNLLAGQIGAYDRGLDPTNPDPNTRELGFFLDAKFWGQGVMKQALQLELDHLVAQGIHEVWAGVFPNNQRSINLLLHAQFEFAFEVSLPAGLNQNVASAERYYRRILINEK